MFVIVSNYRSLKHLIPSLDPREYGLIGTCNDIQSAIESKALFRKFGLSAN